MWQKIIDCLTWYANANEHDRAVDGGERARRLLSLLGGDGSALTVVGENVETLMDADPEKDGERAAATDIIRAILMECE